MSGPAHGGPQSQARWEETALRYFDALDRGDLETLAGLWEAASRDPALEQLLGELTEGLAAEEGPEPDWQADVSRVRTLLSAHIPAERSAPPGPLTIGDVAARLQADRNLGNRLSEPDRAANALLLTNPTPLPGSLGLSQFDRWRQDLGVEASPQYWRAFRHAAVLLSLGSSQQSGTYLAAARSAGRCTRGGGHEPGR